MTNRRSNRWILGILILILIGGILFVPSYGWKIRKWLTPADSADVNAAETFDAEGRNPLAENNVLRAQMAVYQTIASEIPHMSQGSIRALVYSRYPLNFKNEMLVNAGSGDGVLSGAAVTFQGMLIGRVTEVYPHESIIQTVFDSNFEMPVRVGTSSYDGLFEGGSLPKVGSMARVTDVQIGAIVYSAAPGLPYGLPVGTVNSTSTSADSLFTEAAVTFPYDINQIQTVLIAKNQ